MLKEEFDPDDLFDDNDRKEAFRLGGRDVIKYIEKMLEFDRVDA